MLPLSKLVSIAVAHAELEAGGDLEALLATMDDEPVYDFFPIGRRFSGMANTRRYYEHFLAEVQARVVGFVQQTEAIAPFGLVQEYAITLLHAGDAQPTEHQVLAILTFGKSGLSGERMYADEKFFRTLVGPLWHELEPIPAAGG